MVGEWTAVISTILYSFSYLLLYAAQRRGETCDNGVMPILYLGSVFLLVSAALHAAWVKAPPVLMWPQLGFILLSGFCGTFLGRVTFFASMFRLGATRSTVIKSLSPVVTIVTAVTILREPLDTGETIGTVLMLCGVGLLLLERRKRDTRAVFRTSVMEGLAFGLAASVLEGVGHAWRKVGMYGGHPIWAAAFDLTVAALAYSGYLLVQGTLREHIRFYGSVRSLYVWTAAATSAAAVLAFYTAVSTVPVSVVSAIVGIQPVLVALFSSLLFRNLEDRTWLTFVYTPLVGLGVWMVVHGW
ncbi:MAG: DMT family transporter [Alicyclobacillus herbarius]|uniref:DMT family transporter n=1 Tax=Alicyclobacillus herbarius TaxID=122960 RepID=UPI0004141C34|nr:DMT family transporter [Alicyclobacillus herbarius]MCL6631320.1 DMT family transporter [Alicyclobacillus herbarius]